MKNIINKILKLFGCTPKRTFLIGCDPVEKNGQFKYIATLIKREFRIFGIIYKTTYENRN